MNWDRIEGNWKQLKGRVVEKWGKLTDDDIDVRDWAQVIWAVSTRVDPARDSLLVENTPVDYLDFSSPVPNLGSKLGLDATNKWPGETSRAWSRPIALDADVERRVDGLWKAVFEP